MNHFYWLNLVFLLLLMSCNSESPEYKIKEIPGPASCSQYQILDAKNQIVDLPKHIIKALDCAPVLDLTDGVLAYLDENTIKLYRLKDKLDNKMFTMFEEMDGVAGPVWSADRKHIMFVIINQNKSHGYTEFARIISLGLDENLKVKSKLKFDRPVNFHCGGECYSEAYEDFKYVTQGIMFRRNINIEENPGEYEVIEFEQ